MQNIKKKTLVSSTPHRSRRIPMIISTTSVGKCTNRRTVKHPRSDLRVLYHLDGAHASKDQVIPSKNTPLENFGNLYGKGVFLKNTPDPNKSYHKNRIFELFKSSLFFRPIFLGNL